MAKCVLGSRKEAMEPAFVQSVVAEMILTFVFVFAGVGSAVSAEEMLGDVDSTVIGLVAVATTHAMLVAVMTAVGLDVSAGHLNPAVTIGLALSGYITVIRSIFYVTVQLLASSLACFLLKFLTGAPDIPVHTLAIGIEPIQGVIMEAILTFIMVLSNYSIIVSPTQPIKSSMGPILIGLIVGANSLAAGPYTGASMNPARSFGPALVSWYWAHHWVYWVGPLVGSGLAGFVYHHVFCTTTNHNQLPENEDGF